MKYLPVEGVLSAHRAGPEACPTEGHYFGDGGIERDKVKTAKVPLPQGGKFVGGWRVVLGYGEQYRQSLVCLTSINHVTWGSALILQPSLSK